MARRWWLNSPGKDLRVAFFDIQDEPARQLIDSLTAEVDSPPLYFHCDLTDIGALQSAVEEAIEALGSRRRTGEQRGQRSAAQH